MTIEQRTSPETRQALRQRYTPEPEPTCEICESPMVYRDTYGDGSQRWDCTVNDRHPQFGSWRVIGDPDVLAACDDADALAGALAERDDAMEAAVNRTGTLDYDQATVTVPAAEVDAALERAAYAQKRGKGGGDGDGR